MKALIFQNKVVQVQETEFEVSPAMMWVDCPDSCVPGWDYINGQLVEPSNTKTIDDLIAEYSSIIQDHVEGTAMQKQYGNAQSCASYINSTNVQWKSEAEAFIAWRDRVWEYSMQEMPKFINGERQLIPALDFINELPAMAWPS